MNVAWSKNPISLSILQNEINLKKPARRYHRTNVTNLRHAAVLALVGWYLMVPPVNPGKDNLKLLKSGSWWADLNAPLAHWQTSSVFDKASNCNVAQDAMVNDFGKHQANLGTGFTKAWRIAESQACCISTDDSRLKEK
jgi:hypothetical protein